MGMAGLVLLVSFLLLGVSGLLWVAVILGITLFMSSQLPVHYIMRISRARPVAFHEAPDLVNIVGELAKRADLEKTPQLYYIPSNAINAFATGQSPNAAIAITQGLLNQLNPREITGVLAHEMSHIMNNDAKFQGLVNVMSRIVRFFSFIGLFVVLLNPSSIFSGEAILSFILLLLLAFAPTLSNILMLALSRTREFEADLEAARLTGDPNGLANALQKLDYFSQFSRQNMLQNGIPNWMSTHPQLKERVARLRALN